MDKNNVLTINLNRYNLVFAREYYPKPIGQTSVETESEDYR